MADHIYWLQHAPIPRRPFELVGSGTDRPLDEQGIAKAHSIGRNLAHLALSGVIVDLSGKIVTSDLSRALETSEIVAAYLGFEVVINTELRAQNLGVLEEKTVDEADADPLLSPHLHRNHPTEAIFTYTMPGGESVETAHKRLMRARQNLLATEGNPIVITHGSLLKTLVGYFGNYQPDGWGKLSQAVRNRVFDDHNGELNSISFSSA